MIYDLPSGINYGKYLMDYPKETIFDCLHKIITKNMVKNGSPTHMGQWGVHQLVTWYDVCLDSVQMYHGCYDLKG